MSLDQHDKKVQEFAEGLRALATLFGFLLLFVGMCVAVFGIALLIKQTFSMEVAAIVGGGFILLGVGIHLLSSSARIPS